MVSLARKKALNATVFTILFFWTENCLSTNSDEGILEKCMRQWKKMVSTSPKVSFH